MERIVDEPRDLRIVVLLMESLKEEQGGPPVVPDPPPFTDVGSQIPKVIAANYSSHPN